MHVFVNATYIADLILLSPSSSRRPRMGDALHSSEVLSKLSAIMAGDSEGEGRSTVAVDLHRRKPVISLVPCNLRLWKRKISFYR